MRFWTKIKSAIITSNCHKFYIHIKIIGYYFPFVNEIPVTFPYENLGVHVPSCHDRILMNMSNVVTIMTASITSEYFLKIPCPINKSLTLTHLFCLIFNYCFSFNLSSNVWKNNLWLLVPLLLFYNWQLSGLSFWQSSEKLTLTSSVPTWLLTTVASYWILFCLVYM